MDDNDFKYNKNPSIHRYSLQVKDDKKNNIILPYNYYTFKLLYNSPIAPRKQVSSSNTNSPITK